MNWRKIFLFGLCLATFAAFAGLMAYSFNRLEPSKVPSAVIKGKKVWQREGCVECHTVLGAGGYNGPELTHELQKRPGEWVSDFLTNPPALYPSKKRKHPALSEGDAKAIVDYLGFLGRVKTPGWPPKPLRSLGR